VIDTLCHRPHEAGAALRRLDATRVVLGLCERSPSRELTGALRRAGAEPFGIEAVAVAGRPAAEVELALAAALAKLAALSSNDRGRSRLADGAISRRALFSPAAVIVALPVAELDEAACLGAAVCGICVAQCHERAIAIGDPLPAIDTTACTACGACVPRCPTGALRLSGSATPQVEAQLDTLLRGGAAGIVFACGAAAAVPPPGWGLVELPTLALVTPGWILQTRGRGVEVALAPCDEPCCATVRDAEALANALTAPAAPAASAPGPTRLGEPLATADAVRRLGFGADEVVLESAASPLGLLEVDRDRCTVCGACAIACPTSALTLDEGEELIELGHDPGACVACDRCLTACPEDALELRRGIDVARLRRPALGIATARRERCTVCGTTLPPAQMRRRLRELLPLIADTPLELCTGCAAKARRRGGVTRHNAAATTIHPGNIEPERRSTDG
jgi:ferredoxin